MISKFIITTIILFFTLIAFWFFSITTFNPISNSEGINASKNMVEKVRLYELKQPLSKNEIKTYYNLISLSDKEISLIERYGLNIKKVGNGYEVTISQGFDHWLVYRTDGDCWYANKTIVGLNKCAEN